MAALPSKVSTRLVAGIKRFQPILAAAKSRDDGEADTVTIVVDMLAEVFGYDKYSEVTAEYAIRGTYCDLAIKLDGAPQTLIEVKAIGLELKDNHVKQAVDYAANQGVDWAVLTNGTNWRIYKVTFSKPIDHELVIEINFDQLNHRSQKDLELLYLWCKEGWLKSVLGDFHAQKQTLSRFSLAAMIVSEPVLDTVRRELRKVSPDVRVQNDEIRQVILSEILKREVTEGEKAEEARRRLSRAVNKAAKAKESKSAVEEGTAIVGTPEEVPSST